MFKTVRPILVVAFLLRFTLLLINNYLFSLPESGKDAKRFEQLAWDWTTVKNVEVDQFTESGAGAFVKIGSAIYLLVGRNPFIWGICLVVLGTATVYNVYKATLLLWGDKRQGIRVAWYAALFPELALLSAVLLREVLIHFFLSLAVISFIKFWKYKRKSSVVFFLIYSVMCMIFHSAMIMVVGGFALAIIFIPQDGKRTRGIYKVVALLLTVGGILFINYTGFGLSKFGGSLDNALDTFSSQESKESIGNAAYPDWLKVTGGLMDFWKIPARLVAFLFAPAIPVLVKTASHLAGALDAVFYMLIFYSVYKNRKFFTANKAAYAILIMVISLALVYSLGTSNFGTAIRHRAKLLPLLLTFAVDFKALRRKQMLKKQILEVTNIEN